MIIPLLPQRQPLHHSRYPIREQRGRGTVAFSRKKVVVCNPDGTHGSINVGLRGECHLDALFDSFNELVEFFVDGLLTAEFVAPVGCDGAATREAAGAGGAGEEGVDRAEGVPADVVSLKTRISAKFRTENSMGWKTAAIQCRWTYRIFAGPPYVVKPHTVWVSSLVG